MRLARLSISALSDLFNHLTSKQSTPGLRCVQDEISGFRYSVGEAFLELV
jgi:hypothetical protein